MYIFPKKGTADLCIFLQGFFSNRLTFALNKYIIVSKLRIKQQTNGGTNNDKQRAKSVREQIKRMC